MKSTRKIEETRISREQEKELLELTFENTKLELELKKAELKTKIKRLEQKGVLIISIEEECRDKEYCGDCDECKRENKPSFFGELWKQKFNSTTDGPPIR